MIRHIIHLITHRITRRSRSRPGPQSPEPGPAFRHRYQVFQRLLAANTAALEHFAHLEKLGMGNRIFGADELHTHCTAAWINVVKMTQGLEALAPGQYPGLSSQLDRIQAEILPRLDPPTHRVIHFPHILPLEETGLDTVDAVGNKMAHLGEAAAIPGLHLPPGFTVTTRAALEFFQYNDLTPDIRARLRSARELSELVHAAREIREQILAAPLPTPVETAITRAVKSLLRAWGKPVCLALRSSAPDEDRSGFSFAGQYLSLLDLPPDGIPDAYKEILASAFAPAPVQYRRDRGLPAFSAPMAVGCLPMLTAVAGGVMYSQNPIHRHDTRTVIQAVFGPPRHIVDGSAIPQTIYLDTSGRAPDTAPPPLDTDTLEELGHIARVLELRLGAPQDVEWLLTPPPDSRIHVLQTRPMAPALPRALSSAPGPPKGNVLIRGGNTASPGAAYGPVFRVETPEDLLHFPKGAVLLTSVPLPAWAPALGQAAALVSQSGGFAGHLANLAREFEIPALFGIKEVCTILTPGSRVTVDADDQTIYQGKNPAVLAPATPPEKMMEGRPVFDQLQQVLPHITPLHLLDPEASDFREDQCRSLHDLTRFIHEKSVHAMFDFGHRYGLKKSDAKQLFHKVPMQWRILNLDDGFHGEIKGRYVTLEQIASRPMHAVWQGMVAVPWEGPPRINLGGAAAVLFRASADPSLVPGVKSAHARHNYFMVSRHYCSMGFRMGVHLSSLASHAGPRDRENHIRFRFQGGAADRRRRVARVRFMDGLLAHYGFETRRRGDHLTALIKGRSQSYTLDRLRLLGYLVIHTRQLDMIAGIPADLARHGKRFRRDMDDILAAASLDEKE